MGGAASYAARAAAMLGVPTALCTGAPTDWPLLRELGRQPNLSLRVLPRRVVTSFELDYGGPVRRLRCTAAADPILPGEIPDSWRACPVAYVAGVAGECPAALVESLGCRFVAAGLQGWMRRCGPDGTVVPALLPEAESPPERLAAAVLSEEDHPDAEALAGRLAGRGIMVALTRGARGATLYLPGSTPVAVAPEPARQVDPTGAGDVFGVVFALALARGTEPEGAARLATAAAARVVESPGLGTLTPLDAASLARLMPQSQGFRREP
jgi:sugar/nucleoside kinase (ribokinase family)